MTKAEADSAPKPEEREAALSMGQARKRARSAPQLGAVPEAELSEHEKRALVERIAHSPVFSGSQALQGFLRFIAGHAIAGTTANIKEQRIGCEVLGRKPDYDPAEDNIVRVRAHELRQKLARYFETTGAEEPVLITIPRGSYVPVFESRKAVCGPDEQSAVKPASSPIVTRSRGRWLSIQWGGWVAAGVLASALLIQVFMRPPSKAAAESAPPAESAVVRDFWSQLLPPQGEELTVVAADSTFALWQDITGKSLNLGEYLARKQFSLDAADSKLREVAVRRCTSPADLNMAVRLKELATALGGRMRTQYARNLNVRELQTNNAVLIGSRRSNPWVGLFEPRMNFVLAQDANSGAPAFLNRRPAPGEAARYTIPHSLDADGTEQKEMRSYALIAFLPNLSHTGYVLLVEGLNMEGTEAACEFVTNTEGLTSLLRLLGHRTGKPVPPFEALLDLTSVPGGFANTRVIAYRSTAS